MIDKAFKDFMARMNQIGHVAHIHNPLKESMQCRIEIGAAGGGVVITLPPGGEFRFVVSTYDMRCHIEKPTPAQTLSEGDYPNGCVSDMRLGDYQPRHKSI